MSKVFISYRRDDAAGFSHAIYNRLAEHLGTDRVFKDVASIGAVVHFAGFMIAASGTSDLEFGMVLLFGLIPAALIFLGSFAMRRTARV